MATTSHPGNKRQQQQGKILWWDRSMTAAALLSVLALFPVPFSPYCAKVQEGLAGT